MFTAAQLTGLIWLAALTAGLFVYIKTKKMVSKILKEYGVSHLNFDYGLATKKEVIDKFGVDIGTVILEERRIVFWKFGWLWAVIGIVVYYILIAAIKTVYG